MSNLSRFILGFALIVLVAGAGALALLQSLSANDIPQTPVPTATVALPLPTSTEVVPTATPTPEPLTPVVRLPSLAWRRDAVVGSECASLSIDEQGVLRYGDCHGHTVVGYLTQDELAAYLGYVSRYASFDLSTADANGQTVRLVGNGSVVASAAERVTVANWAAGVYERLEEIELRKDRAAQARVALAAKLGVPVDAIDTVRVEAVTWPDACLGLARDGQMCAQVLTPGYRLEFVVNGVSYEYRSDRRGNLVVELQQAAPTATATPLPTWTPVPTSTPWPTATPYPTATPWPTSTPKPTPYPFTVTDWLGEYYNNTSLSGSPALARNDVDVNYDWGYNSPGWGVNTDHFSARWSRKLWFEDGDYSFTVATDDGVRLWVAGNLLIDRWYGGERSTTVKQQIWRGWHEVVIEYFELEGIARAR
ncbi:MAG: hypothetical protein GX557_11220, partial [Chloroflexi bacterium]|nr:hypothetical protein [Chloroflexota bacterium]